MLAASFYIVSAVSGCSFIITQPDDPLDVAASKNDVKFLREWVRQGKPLTKNTVNIAISGGRMETLRFLFEEYGSDPNQEIFGRTVLMKAIEENRPEVVSYLLDHGADINGTTPPQHKYSDRYGGQTALFAVVGGGILYFETTRACGNDPRAQCEVEQATAMMKLLVARGADVKARDNTGFTALHRAVLKNYRDVALLLIEHGADVNAETNNGGTPMYFAGQRDMVRLLIDHGADINHVSQVKGKTTLDYLFDGLASSRLQSPNRTIPHNQEADIKLLREFGAKTAAELNERK